MRRYAVGAIACVVAILFAAATGSAAAAAPSYSTFVGCDDLSESPTPSHLCEVSDFPGAFFESDEEIEIEVCVEFPDGEGLCTEPSIAEAGVLYVSSIESHQAGEYFVGWYLAGTETEIGSFVFEMREPAPPAPPAPPPAVAAPAPTPVPVPEGPSAACRGAEKQVRKLTAQLRRAENHGQKAKLRAKLKKAKAAVKRDC
jgi:hypothetical protein